jgi:hypothetical protein
MLIRAVYDQVRATETRIGEEVARDVYPAHLGIHTFICNDHAVDLECATHANTRFMVHIEGTVVHIVRYPPGLRLGTCLDVLERPDERLLEILMGVGLRTGEADLAWVGVCMHILSDVETLMEANNLFDERAQ